MSPQKVFGATASFLICAALVSAAHADAATFPVDVRFGEQHASVTPLQQFLNSRGYRVAARGPGAPGFETTYFGSYTRDALAAFQRAEGLPATGFFGPLTRALIERLSAPQAAAAHHPPASPACDAPKGFTCIAGTSIIQPQKPSADWTPGYGQGIGTVAASQSADTPPAAPVLSLIASSTNTTSADITWTTDQLADSKVVFSTDSSFALVGYHATLTTSHSIALMGLTSGTTYNFKVVSRNQDGLISTSTVHTFKTVQLILI